MFDTRIPYTPGLATTLVLMLPPSLYAITHVVRQGLMRPVQWLHTFLCMLFGLMLAQQIVVRASGMSYLEFPGNIRKSNIGGCGKTGLKQRMA